MSAPIFIAICLFCLALGAPATAHVSEQGLVLLLPTSHYILSGVLAVAASVILISVAPAPWVRALFQSRALPRWALPPWASDATSLISLLCLGLLLWIGMVGPRDPLTNLFVLTIWVGFWIILFGTIGLSTNLWRAINPWSGLSAFLFGRNAPGFLPLPARLGAMPGLVLFLLFCSFYVVDPAPTDPERLAVIVLVYWVFTLAMIAAFGANEWLARGELFSITFDLMARNGLLGREARGIGLFGWDLLSRQPFPLSIGLFAIVILGVGSFDGLKETFWWLGVIGVNPLEFPGRSFVMGSSALGMAGFSLGLIAAVGSVLWLGERMARGAEPAVLLSQLMRSFAPTILPIALAYHLSHFLVTFLVDGQYLLAAIGDPLARGDNLFGLGELRVTTGFLNTMDTVQVIWLAQASIVVVGHVLAVLVSHHVALGVFSTPRRAALSQIPFAAFMIAYTFFGLWLLASPRGM